MSVTRTRPIPNSYWAVDGHLLAGEYPGAKTEAEARQRLRAFLDAGVRLFVDLTEEGESGLVPYEPVLREVAAELGVEARHLRLPISDTSVPASLERMAAILDVLDEARAAGTLAYVHCWGGTERTGTVVGCLCRRGGASGEDALSEVMRRWSTMEKAPHRPWGSPENERQRQYVLEGLEPVRPRGTDTGRLSRADRVAGCLLAGAPIARFTDEQVRRALAEDASVLEACERWYSGAYLMETVPSVLYILSRHGADPEEAIVRAVNDTRDKDTVAAIVGAAVGALHGAEALPPRWREKLPGRTGASDDGRVFELIERAVERWC